MASPIADIPVAKYVDPAPQAVDLINLCRRIIADWQYQDRKVFGNFVKVHWNKSTTPNSNPIAYRLIRERLMERGLEVTPEMTPFLRSLPTAIYSMTVQNRKDRITAKKFQADPTENLSPAELLKIYWRLRLRSACSIPNESVVGLVEEFRKLKYDGFLLPNGKVVAFESMHLLLLTFVPSEVNVLDFDYQLGARRPCSIIQIMPVAEHIVGFHGELGFLVDHIVLAFNLPEKEVKGNLGKLMILDATCAQFGMKGKHGDLLYWGSLEDYVKDLPTNHLSVDGCEAPKPGDSVPTRFPAIPLVMKTALANLNSEFCGYCGEIERKENPEMELRKCSGCKKAVYCDELCQKLGWRSHRVKCKFG